MPDFSTITERAGDPVPPWQIDQMHHRYAWAAQFCRGKDVIASLPFKEELFARMLMLPMNHFLSDDDAAYVSETVRAFYSSRGTRE